MRSTRFPMTAGPREACSWRALLPSQRVWLASLSPVGVADTHDRVVDVLREQGEDPRAVTLLFAVSNGSKEPLLRAAEAGYARAQAYAAKFVAETEEEEFSLAQRVAA
jgi:hypothetical protein